MESHFFSTGKLLLTSEYVVIDGALSLAVPTRLGQEFSCIEVEDSRSEIIWEAYHQGKPWLFIKINYQNWEILETNIHSSAEFIRNTLQILQGLSQTKLHSTFSYFIKTNLQFPANFGWGSSSTLMVNLAQWAEANPFELNGLALGGSGYDIAVAQEQSPLLYQLKGDKREVECIDFAPPFREELLLLHLNKKQDSREGIAMYKALPKSQQLIHEFSDITKAIVKTQYLDEFSHLMTHHEHLLSSFLNIPTVKQKYFSDCPVFIKSLGAWGGDFVLTTKFEGYKEYFAQKGFTTILDYHDFVF